MKKIFTLMLSVAAVLSAIAQPAVVKMSPADAYKLFGEAMSPNRTYVVGVNEAGGVPSIWNTLTDEVIDVVSEDTVWTIEYTYDVDTLWNYVYDSVPGWVIEWNWETMQEDSVWGMVATETVVDSTLAWSYMYDFLTGEIIDSTCVQENYGVILSADTTGFYLEDATGSFHAVTDAGLAVGELGPEGQGYAIMSNYADGGEYTYLPTPAGEYSSAYGVTADGNTIVGFHFDDTWVTYACVWTMGSDSYTDLPWPTEEEAGFPVEYTEARWVSADGNVILGFAQDYNTGKWVLITWKKEADGSYKVDASLAKNNYNTTNYDLPNSGFNPAIPYADFQPGGLSEDGNWATASVVPNVDPNSEEYWETLPTAVRINLTTGAMEALAPFEEAISVELFGIANNGTTVGKITTGSPWEGMTATPFLWTAGADTVSYIADLLGEAFVEEYAFAEFSLSTISADGDYLLASVNYLDATDDEARQAFIIELLGGGAAVENISSKVAAGKIIENGQVYIIRDGVRYTTLGSVVK